MKEESESLARKRFGRAWCGARAACVWPGAIINERHRGIGSIFSFHRLLVPLTSSSNHPEITQTLALKFSTSIYSVFAGRYCSAPVSFWLAQKSRPRRYRSLLIHLAFLISSQTKTSRTSRLTHFRIGEGVDY